MRASSGLYVSKLDHVRALAAFSVYCWHFAHVHVPYAAVPQFPPFSLFEEGHIGVALFMTLSGYLFAKIINGRPLDHWRFYANRLLRLAPLLALVLAYWAARGVMSAESFLRGFVMPTWSGGAWSIAVELHFYLLFPLILWLQRWHRIGALAALFILSIALKTAVWSTTGTVQAFSYWTIGGAIDLFMAGMLWHELAKMDVVRRYAGAILCLCLLLIVCVWHAFNLAGGFYELGGYPSPSPLWIAIPALQGLLFGAVIVGYEFSHIQLPQPADRLLAKVGEVSYSIYLLHFMLFPSIVKQLSGAGFDMASWPVAFSLAIMTFPLVAALSTLSYRFIEMPFLKLRSNYEAVEAPRPQHHATTPAVAAAATG